MMIERGNCEDIQTSCLCIRRREGKRFFKAAKLQSTPKITHWKRRRKESQSMQEL
jgi:hypothetical protein